MCIELALLKITFSDVSGDASILVLVVVEAWLLTTWHATRPDFWKVISKQVLHLHFSNRLGLLVGKKACFLSNEEPTKGTHQGDTPFFWGVVDFHFPF